MINFDQLRQGNRVMVENEGVWMPGVVTRINADDGGQIEVETGVQKQWYEIEEVESIPLSEEQLLDMGFEKEVMESGNIKFKHGPFRVLISPKAQFTDFLMWYREEKCHITYPMTVHQFQNRYEEMVKVPVG
ncbi:MAG: hypothetical protein MUE71_09115 [Chitinophagaceae bacterium]|nr:hypothetical protein [Chitinophagaceae bacterium]MCU0404358.1 hypothetical protein [Chitinophagaceae bacterium]